MAPKAMHWSAIGSSGPPQTIDPVTSSDDLLLAIGRLEGKVDSILAMINRHAEDIEQLDQRMRRLEQSKSWMLGAAAVVGAASSYFLNFLGNSK